MMGTENYPIYNDDLETDACLATASDAGNPPFPQIQLDTGTMTTVKPEALPEQHRRLFTEARRVEEQKLLPALTILSPKEAAMVPKHRIIPSRWLDSWKRQDSEQKESKYPAHLGIPPGVVAKS
eukprot:4686333-Amphidinium_carterae.1